MRISCRKWPPISLNTIPKQTRQVEGVIQPIIKGWKTVWAALWAAQLRGEILFVVRHFETLEGGNWVRMPSGFWDLSLGYQNRLFVFNNHPLYARLQLSWFDSKSGRFSRHFKFLLESVKYPGRYFLNIIHAAFKLLTTEATGSELKFLFCVDNLAHSLKFIRGTLKTMIFVIKNMPTVAFILPYTIDFEDLKISNIKKNDFARHVWDT